MSRNADYYNARGNNVFYDDCPCSDSDIICDTNAAEDLGILSDVYMISDNNVAQPKSIYIVIKAFLVSNNYSLMTLPNKSLASTSLQRINLLMIRHSPMMMIETPPPTANSLMKLLFFSRKPPIKCMFV